MACRSCGSDNQGEFLSEIAIHLPGLNKPHVFIFPDLLVCFNCGKPEFAEAFAIPENQLGLLTDSQATASGKIGGLASGSDSGHR